MAVVFFEGVERGDVWMGHGSEHLRLPSQPRQRSGIAGQRFREDLERHVTSKTRVAGAIHLPHAAGAEPVFDLVVTEAGAYLHGSRVEEPRLVSVDMSRWSIEKTGRVKCACGCSRQKTTEDGAW